MKNKNLTNLGIIGIICVALIILINSCSKKVPIESSYHNIQSLKEIFEQNNYPKGKLNLVEEIQNDKIIWEIAWESKDIISKNKQGNTYLYIPIKPILASTGKVVLTHQYNRYLLITMNDGEPKFSVANAYLDNDLGEVHEFSGTLLLRNLESGNDIVYNYKNGQLSVSEKPLNGNKLMSLKAMSGSGECITTYSCSWNYYCSSSAELYVTATYSSGDCISPTWNPCPGSSLDNVSWSFAGSTEVSRTCFPPPNPTDPPPPAPGPEPDPSDPSLKIGDPCKEKLRVKSRLENPIISKLASDILGKNDGKEWAAKINASDINVTGFIKTPIVTSGISDKVDIGTPDWWHTTGYTIGVIHNHPGSSAPSVADVFILNTLAAAGGGNGPGSSQQSWDMFSANAFITVLTTDGNYVVMPKDLRLLKNKQTYYEQHTNEVNQLLNSLRNTYIQDYNYTEGKASAAALLAFLKDAINLYKSKPNSTVFEPLEVKAETGEIGDKLCP